ncbi:hypothetical protein [Aurantibacter sp.]|uniref:hypothetical protein n=1 Tax=Aurantibacter sp. TaxID=2807103 RepID=UPI0035C86FE1
MKSKLLTFTLIATVITFFNCKQTEQINVDYKYSDQPEIFNCKIQNDQLIKEAIYSFENDLNEAYDKDNKGRGRAYSSFIGLTIGNRFNIEEVASKHSLQIAKALQQSSHYKNNVFSYNSELANCLFSSIKSANTKTSFEALRSANSLRPSVVLPTLRNNVNSFASDKSLVGILAFDYYYNSLMLLNEGQLKTPIAPAIENQKVDFNKTPQPTKRPISTDKQKLEATGHEGHNH